MSENNLSCSHLRKIKKPLIERKRRERINECLNQLKSLVLKATSRDESRYSKMGKADILEMTVAHLQIMHRRRMHVILPPSSSAAAAAAAVGDHAERYEAGFKTCLMEVRHYLSNPESLVTDDVIRNIRASQTIPLKTEDSIHEYFLHGTANANNNNSKNRENSNGIESTMNNNCRLQSPLLLLNPTRSTELFDPSEQSKPEKKRETPSQTSQLLPLMDGDVDHGKIAVAAATDLRMIHVDGSAVSGVIPPFGMMLHDRNMNDCNFLNNNERPPLKANDSSILTQSENPSTPLNNFCPARNKSPKAGDEFPSLPEATTSGGQNKNVPSLQNESTQPSSSSSSWQSRCSVDSKGEVWRPW